jgi:hypothetical protein
MNTTVQKTPSKAVKVVTNNSKKLENAIKSLDALIEVVEPKKEKPTKKVVEKPKVTFADQVEGNAKFKNAMNVECQKLGYALGLLEKHIECFNPLVQDYIKKMREESIVYKLAEKNCPKSKVGNYTPWLLQGYIRKTINNAK